MAVDILRPFPDSPTGIRIYIMVVMDYFIRWAEAYAIPNQEAATVADKLISEFFLRFSPRYNPCGLEIARLSLPYFGKSAAV